jgi:hypothetical protein
LAIFDLPARLSLGSPSARQSGEQDSEAPYGEEDCGGENDDETEHRSSAQASELEEDLRDLGQFGDVMSFLEDEANAAEHAAWALGESSGGSVGGASVAPNGLPAEDLDDAAARAVLADAEVRLLLANASGSHAEAAAAQVLAHHKQQQAWHRQHSEQQYRQQHQDEQQRFVEHLQVQAQQLAATQAEQHQQRQRADLKLRAAQKQAAQQAAARAHQRAAAGMNAAAAAAFAARQQALQLAAEEDAAAQFSAHVSAMQAAAAAAATAAAAARQASAHAPQKPAGAPGASLGLNCGPPLGPPPPLPPPLPPPAHPPPVPVESDLSEGWQRKPKVVAAFAAPAQAQQHQRPPQQPHLESNNSDNFMSDGR